VPLLPDYLHQSAHAFESVSSTPRGGDCLRHTHGLRTRECSHLPTDLDSYSDVHTDGDAPAYGYADDHSDSDEYADAYLHLYGYEDASSASHGNVNSYAYAEPYAVAVRP
jgi:hypothetical protein